MAALRTAARERYEAIEALDRPSKSLRNTEPARSNNLVQMSEFLKVSPSFPPFDSGFVVLSHVRSSDLSPSAMLSTMPKCQNLPSRAKLHACWIEILMILFPLSRFRVVMSVYIWYRKTHGIPAVNQTVCPTSVSMEST